MSIKALLPIEDTLAGIMRLEMLEQLSNALSAIVFNALGRDTL